MSIIQNICKKESLLSKEIKESNKTNNHINIITKKNETKKNFEDINKTLKNGNNFPPSNFIPSTPPEHDFIYGYLYNNDFININTYHSYNINEY